MQQLGVRRQAGGWQVVAAFTGALSIAVDARARANRKPVILFIRCSFQQVRRGGHKKNRNFNIWANSGPPAADRLRGGDGEHLLL
jgi:hypothetical protein